MLLNAQLCTIRHMTVAFLLIVTLCGCATQPEKTPSTENTMNAQVNTSHQQLDKNRQTKLDAFFEHLRQHDKAMGSVSIAKNGDEVYSYAFGKTDIDADIDATQATKYRIGSVSKTYTAAIIMAMIDENKLSLDTPLSIFFPQFPNADAITIEHLLRHKSGLYNFTNDENYPHWMQDAKTRDELIQIMAAHEPVFQPDNRTEYSNTNYVLLSYIAEELDGMPYGDILRTRIVQPNGLSNTYYGGEINTAMNEATSYKKANNAWTEDTHTDLSIPMGAGGIVSTPHDVNKFFHYLFNGDIVEPQTLETMMTIENGFGIGLIIMPFHNKTIFGHTGGIDGFRAISGYFPGDDVVFTYLTNAADYNVNEIIIGILSIYFGNDYEFPEFLPSISISQEQLEIYEGVYGASNFPLKITISALDGTLHAQATGQPQFPMVAIKPHIFRFDAAGLEIEFLPSESALKLRQGGMEYDLFKE